MLQRAERLPAQCHTDARTRAWRHASRAHCPLRCARKRPHMPTRRLKFSCVLSCAVSLSCAQLVMIPRFFRPPSPPIIVLSSALVRARVSRTSRRLLTTMWPRVCACRHHHHRPPLGGQSETEHLNHFPKAEVLHTSVAEHLNTMASPELCPFKCVPHSPAPPNPKAHAAPDSARRAHHLGAPPLTASLRSRSRSCSC